MSDRKSGASCILLFQGAVGAPGAVSELPVEPVETPEKVLRTRGAPDFWPSIGRKNVGHCQQSWPTHVTLRIKNVTAKIRQACMLLGKLWKSLRIDHQHTIVDQYKGMEIHIYARRFGHGAWKCSIRIYNAPHRALQTVAATLRITDNGVTRQSAMTLAFMEAMSLCDLILENK